MDFNIYPDETMEYYPNGISLPKPLRQELGILTGQFLQLKGKEDLVLQVIRAIEGPFQTMAYISAENFKKLQKDGVEFKVLDVTLGCDPEFFIMWGNRHIIASNYLPFQGQIGSDGGLGELRPMYGRHEDQVIDNLKGLIPRIPGKLRRSRWLTGFPEGGDRFSYEAHSYFRGTPAGFHVHLGIPPEILNTRKDFNRAAISHIVQCLDWYVSVPLIPLEESHQRRMGKTQYGQPGDYRPSNTTLEYRTPGGFYLRSPVLAKGLLGISLMVTEAAVSRMKVASNNFVNLHKLTSDDLQDVMPIPEPSRVRNILKSRDVNGAKAQLPSIHDSMSQFPNYEKHRAAANGLFRAVKEQDCPGSNLLLNWRK